jgi:hypothetical protein
MIHEQSKEECEKIIAKISDETGINNYTMLYSEHELKKSSMQYFMNK